MDRVIEPPRGPIDPSSAEGESPRRAVRGSALASRLRVAALVLAALAMAVIGLEQLTSAPAVCSSCHEMRLRAAEWASSPHANVECVACHVPPHAWYALPATLLDRGKLLGRDTVKHVSASVGVVDSRPAGVPPMQDRVCLGCHDVNRKATSGFRILIDHPEHAKRNGSCVSCHVTVAHPKPTRGAAMSFMTQCFECHGQPKYPKASAKCGVCHPADYELLPASHANAKWKREHGRIEKVDPRQCGMCHKQGFCDSCHGLEMPHPKDWARMQGHPAAAKRDRAVCAKCHEDTADWCTMCHHKAFVPGKGTWVKQHFNEVKTKGASFCLEQCHSPVYCSGCHVRGTNAPGVS